MASFIYARVSTKEQNIEQQIALLKKHAPKRAKVFSEKLSGKTLDRAELAKLKETVKIGDGIYILSVSRLGRNTSEVLAFIDEMKEKKVSVFVHDLGQIDVCSTMGKLVLTTLAAVAEMQRDETLEKQRIGIERAREEGKYKGRQRTPEMTRKLKKAVKDMELGLSKAKAAKANDIGIATLYRYLDELKKDTEVEERSKKQ